MPITEDYFVGVIEDFERKIETLKRIAALGRKQAKRGIQSGGPGDVMRDNLKLAHRKALSISASFENFIRPLVFTDTSAHLVVARTKTRLHKVVREIRDVNGLIEDNRGTASLTGHRPGRA